MHIAHNCKIGKNSILAGKSAISGSVELGENVILAGDVGIADNISIGSNSPLLQELKYLKTFLKIVRLVVILQEVYMIGKKYK